MFKTMQKGFTFPLEKKPLILGSRIETQTQPGLRVLDSALLLSDTWKIQLVCTDSQNYGGEEITPELLELEAVWEETLEWHDSYPRPFSWRYIKKPHIITSHIETKNEQYYLHLIVETTLEPVFTGEEPGAAAVADNQAHKGKQYSLGNQKTRSARPGTEQEEDSIPLLTADLEQRLNTIEKEYEELKKTVWEMSNKMQQLEQIPNDPAPQYSSLCGTVFDAFRMYPIAQTIIEIYESGAEEPKYKLASDLQGKYSCDQLPPGVYSIKVKHPRYLTLSLKEYVLQENEKKLQDFLLRRL